MASTAAAHRYCRIVYQIPLSSSVCDDQVSAVEVEKITI